MSVSRIIGLKATNVLRLKAVNIRPKEGDHVVKVGGKNKSGKTSLLNSIMMVLGGKSVIPEEPIRQGQNRGEVSVDLGDYVATLKFWRAKLPCDCERGQDTSAICTAACSSNKWGKTNSELVVKSPEGATYPAPQSLLNKIYGSLAFDPQAFITMDEKQQAETLRRIVGLDVSKFDETRATAYQTRTALNRQLRDQKAILEAMPSHEGVPSEELSSAEVTDKMTEAEKLRGDVVMYAGNVGQAQNGVNTLSFGIESSEARIKELEAALAKERDNHQALVARHTEAEKVLLDAKAKHEEAITKVPDTTALTNRLREIEDINQKVRANKARQDVENGVAKLEKRVADETSIITASEESKRNALAAAKFPVPGLGFNDDGVVTLNNLPLAQASTAEQLQVSVAIGLALNPSLKVMLVRNGNAMDNDSLAILEALAEKHDAQVWMEWVTDSSEGMSVLIEDGEAEAV